MKILRMNVRTTTAYYNCHILTGERKYLKEGARVLYDDGDYTVGPLKVVGHDEHSIIVLADEDYCIFEHTDLDEAEPEDLIPLVDMDYEPVTSSIYLDGFLGASYIDESTGLIRVDLNENIAPLKDYYSNLMDENGIEYNYVSDGFIISDTEILDRIYEKQHDLMPPKYAASMLLSFVLFPRIRINRNPKYARYYFVLTREEELYGNVAPMGMFYFGERKQCAVFSIFGSFEPYRYLIDSIDVEEEDVVFDETVHSDEVFEESVYPITMKILVNAGYSPRIAEDVNGYRTFTVPVKTDEGETTFRFAVSAGKPDADLSDCSCAVVYVDREPLFYRVESGSIIEKSGVSLFSAPMFHFSSELRDFISVVLKKM